MWHLTSKAWQGGSEAERRQSLIGSDGGWGVRRLVVQMNVCSDQPSNFNRGLSATCFELEAQPLVFYGIINVRAAEWKDSRGEKCSRCPFYICTFDGIPGTSSQNSCSNRPSNCYVLINIDVFHYPVRSQLFGVEHICTVDIRHKKFQSVIPRGFFLQDTFRASFTVMGIAVRCRSTLNICEVEKTKTLKSNYVQPEDANNTTITKRSSYTSAAFFIYRTVTHLFADTEYV